MATRTILGTAKAKASGTSVTLAAAACSKGDSLGVWVWFKGQTLPASVKWGGRKLSKEAQRLNATDDFSVAFYQARRIQYPNTLDIVAAWASALGAKGITAFKLDSPHVVDQILRNIQGASTAPTVGPTAEHTRADDFVTGLLCAEGPTGDTAPTLGGGFTAGQIDGTGGGGAATNLKATEGYQQMATSVGVTLSGTGATSRPWTNVVIALRPTLNCVWDRYGNEIEVGDTVVYKGNARNVDGIRLMQNHVQLATDGWVGATETELEN